MSYTLYGDLGSGAFSAEAALAEAGAPYRFELVSLEKNEQKQPAFLAINPIRQDPGAAPAGRRDRHRIRRHPAHPGRSFSPGAACCRRRPAMTAPRPIAGWPSWRAKSIRLWRSWIIPSGSRRRAVMRRRCAPRAQPHPRTHSDHRAHDRRAVPAGAADFRSWIFMPRCSRAGAWSRIGNWQICQS